MNSLKLQPGDEFSLVTRKDLNRGHCGATFASCARQSRVVTLKICWILLVKFPYPAIVM